MAATLEKETVYLIRPRLGGLANDLQIMTEDEQLLFGIKSKVFAPLGKTYRIFNAEGHEAYRTKQDTTAMFPRHSVLKDDNPVAKVGQSGVIPQKYYVKIGRGEKCTLRMRTFESIFNLESHGGKQLVELAQHRSTWIVVPHDDKDLELTLVCLGLIYRENCVGG
jgi:uncharacterized protein YxjI